MDSVFGSVIFSSGQDDNIIEKIVSRNDVDSVGWDSIEIIEESSAHQVNKVSEEVELI